MAVTIQPVTPHIVQKIRDEIPGLFVRLDAREPNDPSEMIVVRSLSGSSQGHPNPRNDPHVQFISRAPDRNRAMANAYAVFNEFLDDENGVILRAPDNLPGHTDIQIDRFALLQEPYHMGIDRETSEHIYVFNARLTYFPRP